jgi:protease-4
MRRTLDFATTVLALAAVPWRVSAQSVPGDFVTPGSTVATVHDADAARINPGAVPLVRWMSARITGVAEVRANRTALDGAAVSLVSPLPFDFGVSASLSWQHSLVAGAQGDVVTGDVGLGYAPTRTFGMGARLRVMGAGGDATFASIANGSAALDLGLAWRPLDWLSLGLVGRNLVGPQIPALGIARAGVAGIAVRPAGTDVFTFGVDASYAQGNTGWVRASTRVRIPYVGYVVADGVLDLPSLGWRTSAGVEVDFGMASLSGGVLVGDDRAGLGNGPLGGWMSARVEGVRERGIPEGGMLVAMSTGDLGARELAHVVISLERFTRDPAVRGIVWTPRGDVGGLAHAEELREAFTRLRASGRRVFCHLVEPNGSTYYACSAAESVTIDPAGSLRSAGLRTTFLFLGDALRDLGVRTQFLRIGAWKSAPEQFTRRGSTPEARAQEEQLVDDFYAHLLGGIAASRTAAGRAWSPDDVRRTLESGPYTARETVSRGFADSLVTRDRALAIASQRAHAPVIEWSERVPFRPERWAPGRSVAVVYLDGDIIEGESFEVPFLGMRFVGDRTVRATLAQLVADPSVGAIVLRVDSGGGAAMAAENMWRAVASAARHKPVVVSVGRMAASAAYYLAAPAAEIVADPSSVTGSIGIFYGKADLSPLLSRLDVGVETLRRGEHADLDSMYRAWTDDETRLLGHLLEEGYEQFLGRVAEGRHMTREAVHGIGEGRVFAGSRARGLGLVDRTGGLWLAIERARALGHLASATDIREVPSGSAGLLESLVSIVSASEPTHSIAQLAMRGEAGTAMRWLYAVALSNGHAMAMIDWPMEVP